MRDRPFLSGGESPRPFLDVAGERLDHDPRRKAIDQAADLEAEALDAEDPLERQRLQLQAEELRAALNDNPRR